MVSINLCEACYVVGKVCHCDSGGFYDKYMSHPEFRAYKIGIAYACQIFDSLPHAEHDIMVDEVVII